ncbi:hypothetical protein VNO80_29603 [Phaseolus coccineus]|uniref:Rx N-terminal domain-containing protein n=1 Tax=Phaseolus coccineus TaxID=3886 RepID=A0AAN9LBA7_PHACN
MGSLSLELRVLFLSLSLSLDHVIDDIIDNKENKFDQLLSQLRTLVRDSDAFIRFPTRFSSRAPFLSNHPY